jgi:hypothetical protein
VQGGLQHGGDPTFLPHSMLVLATVHRTSAAERVRRAARAFVLVWPTGATPRLGRGLGRQGSTVIAAVCEPGNSRADPPNGAVNKSADTSRPPALTHCGPPLRPANRHSPPPRAPPITADFVRSLYDVEEFENVHLPFLDSVAPRLQEARVDSNEETIGQLREMCADAVFTLLAVMRAATQSQQRRTHRVAFQVIRIMAADPSHWTPSALGQATTNWQHRRSPPTNLHAFLHELVTAFPAAAAVKTIASAGKLGLLSAADAEVSVSAQVRAVAAAGSA